MEDALSLLPIVAIAVIFWLLIIRPASRQRKQAAELQAALGVGDDIMLTSGIFGTIVGAADDHLQVELAPGVVIRVVRGAVASVSRDAAATPADEATDAVEPAAERPETTTDPDEER
ncbi:preprotein translocase subunit YajC [Nocardioides sp. J9]|uniref:preprotein translocase subunit YajC n=1 Tax=unclassified Nocardioides TaxID=2615069 RepID=UPI0004B66F4F|nr:MULTISPECIES: preprotein translocase subunit YajC [unclassified Nocardioides]TWG97271.1 preprotein translocase subunit YajC [Nocardioides sp. J9]